MAGLLARDREFIPNFTHARRPGSIFRLDQTSHGAARPRRSVLSPGQGNARQNDASSRPQAGHDPAMIGRAAGGGIWWPQRPPSHAKNMPGLTAPIAPLDLVAHVIQVALTPVFLLSGVATLLNVFSTRLARVADLISKAADSDDDGIITGDLGLYLRHLRRRSVVLDVAVVLGAIAGALTCASVLTLFVGALKDATVASVLFTTFGLAVICTIGAIGAFTVEMLMAGSGMRTEIAAAHHAAKPH